MFRKSVISVILVCSAAFADLTGWVPAGSADQASSVRVTKFAVNGSLAFFKIEGYDYPAVYYGFDCTTASGKAMLSSLITGYTNGKGISFWCTSTKSLTVYGSQTAYQVTTIWVQD